jgi:hypothetical protein
MREDPYGLCAATLHPERVAGRQVRPVRIVGQGKVKMALLWGRLLGLCG